MVPEVLKPASVQDAITSQVIAFYDDFNRRIDNRFEAAARTTDDHQREEHWSIGRHLIAQRSAAGHVLCSLIGWPDEPNLDAWQRFVAETGDTSWMGCIRVILEQRNSSADETRIEAEIAAANVQATLLYEMGPV